ncbi:MAG: succinate dehydrogenase, cytochrome b556 subunit [Gammaproteobacteria bacterium]|jgi:succinate dehydrogenase / fumarate reductase cytochrome b subunit|nr:succinate dehydrogenase, cytochrome b556 subunit [Gammaproteobacteria bacterium]
MPTLTQRPLSPHLQIYRLPITAVLSISHRFSGAALVIGVMFLTWVLVAAARGPGPWTVVQGFATSWPGLVLLFIWTWVLYFHFCNGARHLLWDLGYGFNIDRAGLYAWSVIVASVVLTVLTWLIATGGA